MRHFKLFEPYADALFHGVSSKNDGDFNDESPEFTASLKNIGIDKVVCGNQIHTDVILDIENFPEERPDGDAFITQTKNIPLMAKTADCQGVFMYDPTTQTIAMVHSGWKGSTLNIIGKTVRKLEKDYNVDPGDLLVGIGPSLGPNSAEFSDPYNELPAFCHKHIKEGNKVDFWALTKAQLTLEGVREDHIEFMSIDSVTDEESYSHRCGDKERMANIIALKP